MSDDLVKQICEAWVNDGLENECFWEGWPDCPTQDSLTPKMVLTRIEALEAQLAEREWQPIETAPVGVFVLCAHEVQKWLRFGNYYNDVGRWYYSGTNERSQWSQVEGDAPTHWMALPEPPKAAEKGTRDE